MRKFTLLLSTLIMVSMLLVACGGEETSTAAPNTSLPTMEEPTSAATSTEAAPAGTETAGTGTPGVPVTGEDNPSRLSNQLDFNVWNQDGEQIGEVDDMVLDLGDAAVSYVVVGTGGFLDIGEKEVLVPWDSLELQTKGGDMTGGEQNAFVLQTDQETFNNAPDVDVNSILPSLSQTADDWDLEIRNYWEGGGAVPAGTPSTGTSSLGTPSAGTSSTNTPSTGTTGTAMPEVSGTASLGLATAMPGGTGVTTGALQGVVLATDVLGSNITVGMHGAIVTSPGQVQGTGTPVVSTAMPATTETPSTTTNATPSTSTLNTATPSTATGTNNLGELANATIEDVIVDPDTGDIQYIVISSSVDNNEHWIPVPLNLLRWDASTGAFALDTDQAMLQGAPFFTADEFPNTTLDGWDADFSSYWSGAGTGTGTGTNPTATP